VEEVKFGGIDVALAKQGVVDNRLNKQTVRKTVRTPKYPRVGWCTLQGQTLASSF